MIAQKKEVAKHPLWGFNNISSNPLEVISGTKWIVLDIVSNLTVKIAVFGHTSPLPQLRGIKKGIKKGIKFKIH